MFWWVWVIAGFGLLVLELMMLPSGFIVFVIGLAFILTGVLNSWGIFPELYEQLIFCSVASILFAMTVRRFFLKLVPSGGSTQKELGTVEIMADILDSQIGEGEHRGTMWRVKNLSGRVLSKGEKVQISRIDGFEIIIHKK